MDRKAIIFAIAAFLAVLFVSTIGTSLTGFTVLDQSQITLEDYPYPFIKNNMYNDIYIVIPYNYDAEEYTAALRIANSLQTTQPLLPKIVTDKTLPEGEHNLIIIGNPCNNELIAKELDTNRCSLGLDINEGLVQLINHKRTSSLVISGDSDKASRVLTSNFYPLIGTRVIVTGTKSLSLAYG